MTFFIWLAVWLGASAVFLTMVFIMAVLRERADMKRREVPRPSRIIAARLALGFCGAAVEDVGTSCVGREVWLDWSLRWGPCGEGSAWIVERLGPGELRIRISHEVDYLEHRVSEFVFRVERATGSFTRGRGAARGMLLPPETLSLLPATATIVIVE